MKGLQFRVYKLGRHITKLQGCFLILVVFEGYCVSCWRGRVNGLAFRVIWLGLETDQMV